MELEGDYSCGGCLEAGGEVGDLLSREMVFENVRRG